MGDLILDAESCKKLNDIQHQERELLVAIDHDRLTILTLEVDQSISISVEGCPLSRRTNDAGR